MAGLVSLIGAGPGDPELLTLKALRRLREADLVIYDYLANPDHLRHTQKDTVKIGVGKGFRHKAISQDKINRLIVRFARSGKRVVRLKGGDPYLFGRGGEEALHLVKNNIPFEVVPGVTSATACAAYAGIPLTHRDHNASVTFLTGHRAQDETLDSIRWNKIAAIGGTLVIYMGFYNLRRITAQLIRAGMPVATPVAVVEWGTLARQKTVSGALGDIAEKVSTAKLAPPCMIIIGDVVSLRAKLGWFEKLPLFGKKIVITRAEEGIGTFREKLMVLGADVLELPLIQIVPPDDWKPLDAAIRDIHQYDWLLFASAYGVRYFFERLAKQGKDARFLAGIQVASVGAQTSRVLKECGIRVDLEPEHFHTAAIVEALKKKKIAVSGQKFLLLRTNIAPPELEAGLKKLGAKIERVTAYKTTAPTPAPVEMKARVLNEQPDFMAFTSASTVHHFVKLFGKAGARKISRNTRFLSIGPVTTKTLKSYGFKPYLQAGTFTVDGLVADLVRKHSNKMTKKR